MRVSIGQRAYTVGLNWQIADSREAIQSRMEETGADAGVVLKSGKAIVGVGFATGEGRNPPPSAAAMLALHYPEGTALCVIEWADAGTHDRRYWMAAISAGAVVSGTDIVVDDAAFLRRQVQELVHDFGCRVAGSASQGFAGDGEPVLASTDSPKTRAAAAIKSLQPGTSPVQAMVLLILLAGVAAMGWLALKPTQTDAPAIPVIDSKAEQRRQAIALRNQMLSQDLSGFSVLEFHRLALQAGKSLERSAAQWRLVRKRCDVAGCTDTWQAMGDGSVPGDLSKALGIPRDRVTSDTRAQTVSVSESPGATGTRIDAVESTPLTGRIQGLIDRCRRYGGKEGACKLDPAQPIAIPNGEMLPPGLKYQRGRFTLSGRLGGMGALLPLFDGEALVPWVRADSLELDYEQLEFRLEGHYVIH
ncbi:MAG: hypothetical protein DM484_19880 [Candidatus Methylumidiphilus alinenensis]|uniref:Uncharacterized protein n=1 Tax=Candidatus Methylumidiphilus alinenensis TaxID=2202197 RepID=A0A2W4SWK1_9GAMM|nr:MAG: hypothetical protein DM484_19880 [Candidatus Methylumidiphilus alinenensis]